MLALFVALPSFAKHNTPQEVNEGTTRAGILGGVIVGGVVAAASRSPYGLLAIPVGALIGVLIKRHRNKKRMEAQYLPRQGRQKNYNQN